MIRKAKMNSAKRLAKPLMAVTPIMFMGQRSDRKPKREINDIERQRGRDELRRNEANPGRPRRREVN